MKKTTIRKKISTKDSIEAFNNEYYIGFSIRVTEVYQKPSKNIPPETEPLTVGFELFLFDSKEKADVRETTIVCTIG